MSKLESLIPKTAIVEEVANKVRPYTVTTVADINAYREERKQFESEWIKEYVKREAKKRQIAHNMVAEQTLEPKITLTEAESREIEYRKTRDDDDVFTYKSRYIPGSWDKQNMAEKSWAEQSMLLYIDEQRQKQSFLAKIKSFFSGVFES